METLDEIMFKGIKEKLIGPLFYFKGVIINKGFQNPFSIGDIIEVRKDYTSYNNGLIFGYGYKISRNIFGQHGFLRKEDLIPLSEWRDNQIDNILKF